jgi:hypothetical protein
VNERERGAQVLAHAPQRVEPLALLDDEFGGARSGPRRQRRERAIERAPDLVPDERGGDPLTTLTFTADVAGVVALLALAAVVAAVVRFEDQTHLPVFVAYPSHRTLPVLDKSRERA